jgi:hypothetical protein
VSAEQKLTRRRDRLDGEPPQALDVAPLEGRWITFAGGARGIAEVEVAPAADGAEIRVLGSAPDGEPDWGTAAARLYAGDVGGSEVWGFRASYDHGYERVQLYAYLNRGLLCVEAGTTFTDASGRAPYFTRSFYFRP